MADTYKEYQHNASEYAQLQRQMRQLEERNNAIKNTHGWKDARIEELENRVTTLEKELEPYRKKEDQKRLDAWSSQPCTGNFVCGCRTCRDL